MERRSTKFHFKTLEVFFLLTTILLLIINCASAGTKLSLISDDKNSVSSSKTDGGNPEKKVSFTSEKSNPKIFGDSVQLPWPFNFTNNIPLPNQNPQGSLTGGSNTNLGDNAGNFGGAFGTLGTSAVLVSQDLSPRTLNVGYMYILHTISYFIK